MKAKNLDDYKVTELCKRLGMTRLVAIAIIEVLEEIEVDWTKEEKERLESVKNSRP